MTLVSILSLTEMRFIKEVLRDKRFLDVPQTYYDVNFYVHIGLLQTQDYDKYIWENGYYATYFTAWNQNRNSSGNCTRMNFQMFDDDQTWEREDCVHELAEYIMCDMNQLETKNTI
ncbi:uncharacterized protein LOC132749999 [Ruditapes philippinarum]|uniref:uncharacterized protein LOC132749999 n=1 Tax=Ruditapes philippinarum TaxID=129788 RepID=UPI00295B46CF|nr:uncharacterized protein LOC132749999 [Ruditapes philippinarum]